MANEFTFSITTTRFDEDYSPSESSRITTNFANLARGEHRQQNLRNALTMIDRRFNDLAHWDNPDRDRYTVELEIVSAELQFTADGEDRSFPLLEMLDVQIVDLLTGERIHGIVGNNFSSYVRDFDFSVLLPAVNEGATGFTVPDDFGDLHGKLFQHFLDSAAYRERFPVPPVICISVSTSRTYRRTENHHPILGVEYQQDEFSLTDEYFAKDGARRSGTSCRPAASRRSRSISAATCSTTTPTCSSSARSARWRRSRRSTGPEIYNANSAAAGVYRPSLEQQDYSRTQIAYDRVERSQLAVKQGKYTEEHFMKPHREAAGAVGRQLPRSRRMTSGESSTMNTLLAHLDRRQPAEAVVARAAGNPLVSLEAGGRRAGRGQAGCAAHRRPGTAPARHRHRQRRRADPPALRHDVHRASQRGRLRAARDGSNPQSLRRERADRRRRREPREARLRRRRADSSASRPISRSSGHCPAR